MKKSDPNKKRPTKKYARPNTQSGVKRKSSSSRNQEERADRPKQPSQSDKSTPKVNPNPRLNKYIASAGIASRRKADELIEQGFVAVNEEVIREMGYRVQPKDVVKFKGKIVKPQTKKVYLLLNKPKNTITTSQDPQGRKTVMEIVQNACEERIYPVGRLDRNTTGLLLLTNDGDLAKKLSHPSYNIKKVYHVTLDKNIPLHDLEAISNGLTLEDGLAEVDMVTYAAGDKRKEVMIEIHIGKNRIVRRIFAHLGYEVIKLDRVYYAGLTKKDLSRGKFRHLKPEEVRLLKHFT